MIIEGKLLLAMGRVVGVIQIKHLVLQTRKRGGTGQVVLSVQGEPLTPQFEHGIMAETIGVISVGIARGDLIDTLGGDVPNELIADSDSSPICKSIDE